MVSNVHVKLACLMSSAKVKNYFIVYGLMYEHRFIKRINLNMKIIRINPD